MVIHDKTNAEVGIEPQEVWQELLSIMGKSGNDVSKYNETFLSKSLQKRMTETHCDTMGAYGAFLKQNNNEVSLFQESLHNSYSEFFRNTLTFSVLEHLILPTLILNKKDTRNKEIRIWSAACAAGQEAYSLAMLLEELQNGNDQKISYRIFATDQRESQVNEARKGLYSAAAMTNLNMKRVKQWFTKQGEFYLVNPELKQNIDFSVFDLFSTHLSAPQASIFGDFDLVVCANLLFYYKPNYQKEMIKKVDKSLAKNAYLVAGEAERDLFLHANYVEAFPQSGIFKK